MRVNRVGGFGGPLCFDEDKPCCIENGYDLLDSDKDFEPFARHLNLRVV